MYESPPVDPRLNHDPPMCEYRGIPIEERPQRRSAPPGQDTPRERGYCHPDPYDDSQVTTNLDLMNQ